jgi:predicted RNA-binding Zn-ribbon protein involved in translation (DUF1610 family)
MKKIKVKSEGDERSPKLKIQRVYPEKVCSNTINCLSGGKYIPRDKRQTFCTPKCGENYRNDQRHLKNNREYANEKRLRIMDKKLERLFNHFLSGSYAVVWIEFFRYEGIDFSLMVYESKNSSTNQSVRWFYRYGVERHPDKEDFFKIYKRKI